MFGRRMKPPQLKVRHPLTGSHKAPHSLTKHPIIPFHFHLQPQTMSTVITKVPRRIQCGNTSCDILVPHTHQDLSRRWHIRPDGMPFVTIRQLANTLNYSEVSVIDSSIKVTDGLTVFTAKYGVVTLKKVTSGPGDDWVTFEAEQDGRIQARLLIQKERVSESWGEMLSQFIAKAVPSCFSAK
jgi:hypothetical protein